MAASSSKAYSSSSPVQRLTIRGVNVVFPCKPYPSQFSLMDKVITGCKNATHGLLESPTGSGKSLALLCSALAWQKHAATKWRDQQAAQQEALDSICFCGCHFREKEEAGKKDVDVEKNMDEWKFEKNNKMPNASSSKEDVGKTLKMDDEDDDFKPSKAKKGKPRKSIKYDDDDDEEDEEKENWSRETMGDNKESHDDKVVGGCRRDCCETAGMPHSAEQKKMLRTGGESCCSKKGKTDGVEDEKEAGPSTSSTNVDILPKIYFCTRTHKQISQIVREFKKTEYSRAKMTILASREHTCVEPEVSRSRNKNEGCNEKLRKRKKGDVEGSCGYYDNAQRINHRVLTSNGFGCGWDVEDLLRFGRRNHACPFYASKALRDDAEIIFCPYNYLIDPSIRASLEINLAGHVVILDEAHNMEDISRESASMEFKRHELEEAMLDLDKMIQAGILPEEHARLKLLFKQMALIIMENSDNLEKKSWELESKVLNGAETIRMLSNKSIGPEEFSNIKQSLHKVNAEQSEPSDPLQLPLNHSTMALLKGVIIIFTFLFRNECKDSVDYKTVIKKMKTRNDFASSRRNRRRSGGANTSGVWLSSASGGGDDDEFEYRLQFLCLNPAVAFVDMARNARSVILASGTLSPMDSFQSELGLNFVQQLEANHVIKDKQVLVSTVGIAPNGTLLKATHQNTDGLNFQDGLGDLVAEICARTPHGVLCFFSSYSLMNKLTKRWQSTGLWRAIGIKKKLFVEPRGGDKDGFDKLLNNFYAVIVETNSGPTPSGHDGALLFAVCRGKISEGMDFTDNNARAVITVGIPYPSFVDTAVMEKKKYNNNFSASRGLLNGDKWYEIQAYRALNQALGRCLRHKNDWGALVLVDARFRENPHKYISGLSKWVKSKVTHFNSCVEFLRELGEFQESRRREDDERKNESPIGERKESAEKDVDAALDDVPATNERKPSDPDAPLYSIFTTITPKRPPPIPQPEASLTSSYFPSPASGVFLPTPSSSRSSEVDGDRIDDDDDEERMRREFEHVKAEVTEEMTAVENERKKNKKQVGGKKKYDWRAKRDEARQKRRDIEEKRIQTRWEEEEKNRKEEKEEEDRRNEEKLTGKSDAQPVASSKPFVISDDSDVEITAVTKATSWSAFENSKLGSDGVSKSASTSVVDDTSGKGEVGTSKIDAAMSNRKRLLFAPSQITETVIEPSKMTESWAKDSESTTAKMDPTANDDDEAEMDLFNDGTDDDEDLFAAASKQLGSSAESEDVKTEINDDGGEMGVAVERHPFFFSSGENEDVKPSISKEDVKNRAIGGQKRCLSSDSQDGDDTERKPRGRTNSVTPVKMEMDELDDDDFVDNKSASKKYQRRPSLKRFKKTAEKSWTAAESSTTTTTTTTTTNKTHQNDSKVACSSVVRCRRCDGILFSPSPADSLCTIQSLGFSLPHSVSIAGRSTSRPASFCSHADQLATDSSTSCLRVAMKPREKEAAFAPLATPKDEITGLPTVSWAESLGCALKALSCFKCPSGSRSRSQSSSNAVNFVALEVMNDSTKTCPPLKKGDVLFPTNLIQVCPEMMGK